MKNWFYAALIVLMSVGVLVGIGYAATVLNIAEHLVIILMLLTGILFLGFLVYMTRNYLEDRHL